MKKTVLSAAAFWAVSGWALAALSLAPLTSFSGDGWFAPGEGGYAFLGTGNAERSLAFNGVTGNLILASGNVLRRINGTTGTDAGALDITGISGGTRPIQQVRTDDSGAVYVTNLAVAGESFKVDKYSGESATPTVVFSGVASGSPRLGDSFDVRVIGGSPMGLVSGSGTTGVRLISLDGLNTVNAITSISAAAPATVPAAGDFRLGLAFVDDTTLVGTPGGTARVVNLTGATTGEVVAQFSGATSPSWNPSERALEHALVDGTPVLVTVRSINNASPPADQSTVNLYEATDGGGIALLDSKNLVTLPNNNVNGTGGVAFGSIGGESVVYVLNTNNGIQAFSIVPEPAAVAFVALGLVGVLRRRR